MPFIDSWGHAEIIHNIAQVGREKGLLIYILDILKAEGVYAPIMVSRAKLCSTWAEYPWGIAHARGRLHMPVRDYSNNSSSNANASTNSDKFSKFNNSNIPITLRNCASWG